MQRLAAPVGVRVARRLILICVIERQWGQSKNSPGAAFCCPGEQYAVKGESRTALSTSSPMSSQPSVSLSCKWRYPFVQAQIQMLAGRLAGDRGIWRSRRSSGVKPPTIILGTPWICRVMGMIRSEKNQMTAGCVVLAVYLAVAWVGARLFDVSYWLAFRRAVQY